MSSRAARARSAGRGSKKALITTFIDSLLTDEFTVSAVRENAPGVSDAHISKVLAELKQAGIIEPLGTGRGARWRRLSRQRPAAPCPAPNGS